MLAGKKITIGITGGIAAYKSCEIVRELKKKNASVTVIMTANAQQFVTPLTFRYLSGEKVITGMFDEPSDIDIKHISLSKETDLLLVAPATANIIAKFSGGICDDFLSTFFISYTGKVLIAPAMNTAMFNHNITQSNIKKLSLLGVRFIDPASGSLACGDEGIGRLADVEQIISAACNELLKKKDLTDEKILVTAGPTREYLDPFRFISNPSSGKMGYAIAAAAERRGADVTLITGPTNLQDPSGIKTIHVGSAEEMRKEVLKKFKSSTITIKAAAVSDFSPEEKVPEKIKKDGNSNFNLKLKLNPDILKEICKSKSKDQIVVGFSAESSNLIKNSMKKMKDKGCDLIVANDITKKGSGFETATNIVTIIDSKGAITQLPELPKEEVADLILDKVIQRKKCHQ
ncbi:MAG: bifunctional phosphopantothenoylcysteine decarboxylase/phosphopantothenate--cysteine ligase CoaBC [Candidatus Schekmanbacteria bacterium]|nr:bifunctional phosphopantothenoylcysteine decarboxylase/phosphopantothenate--cysteine ligase CoaBC [Candidatus Schekmanbacteria bacterium]